MTIRNTGMQSALAGVRVLDLSRLVPGPLAGRYLADLGAEVIKIEEPGGEPLRAMDDAWFAALNFGKQSVVLDLKDPGGRETLLALCKESDVLLESFRPGTLDRLKLEAATLFAANPKLVICRLSGYGQDGPLAQRAGHDIGYTARAGVLDLLGEDPARRPVQAGVQIADVMGSVTALAAICAALLRAERTGQGADLDITLCESALPLLSLVAPRVASGADAPRGSGELGGGIANYRLYACKEGSLALGALEPKFWKAACEAMERPQWIERWGQGAALEEDVAALLRTRTRDEWMKRFDAFDCCVEPVWSPREALQDPQLVARAAFTTVAGTLVPRCPVRAIGESELRAGAVPALDEHGARLRAEPRRIPPRD